MKTKIAIKFESMPETAVIVNDSTIRDVLKAITGEMSEDITAADITSFLKINRSIYTITSRYKTIEDKDGLHLSNDDGKTYPLTLTWVEIHELRAQPTDRMQELGKIMYPHSTYSDMPGVMELANEINDTNDIGDLIK